MAEKISRKDLKQPDEFITMTSRAVQWIVSNRVILIATTVAVVVAILAVFAYRWYAEDQTMKASAAFMKAMKLFDAPVVASEELEGTTPSDGSYASATDKYKAALQAFEGVVSAHGGSDAANLSTYYLGECYRRLGESEKAISAFQDYLMRVGLNAGLSASAIEGIGATFEDQKKIDEAKAQYQRLTEDNFTSSADRGLYHLARLEQATGNMENAARMFRSIVKEHPDTIFARDIQERLSVLPLPPVDATEDSGASDPPSKVAAPPAAVTE